MQRFFTCCLQWFSKQRGDQGDLSISTQCMWYTQIFIKNTFTFLGIWVQCDILLADFIFYLILFIVFEFFWIVCHFSWGYILLMCSTLVIFVVSHVINKFDFGDFCNDS